MISNYIHLLDFDQISQNMNAMLRETALLLVESSVSRLKNTISLCVGQLQEIIELASKYKSGKKLCSNL